MAWFERAKQFLSKSRLPQDVFPSVEPPASIEPPASSLKPAPSAPVYTPKASASSAHMIMPLLGQDLSLQDRAPFIEALKHDRALNTVLRAHQLQLVDIGQASDQVHEKAQRLGVPPQKAPWMLAVQLRTDSGVPASSKHTPQGLVAFEQELPKALERLGAGPMQYDRLLFESAYGEKSTLPRQDRDDIDVALKHTMIMIRTFQDQQKPLPPSAETLARSIANHFGEPKYSPRTKEYTYPEKPPSGLGSSDRIHLAKDASKLLPYAEKTSPSMEEAFAKIQHITRSKSMEKVR